MVLNDCSLDINKIDLFATGLGPGSFTGIRIAVNVAKTFSYLLHKPIVAMDSLTLLANQCAQPDLPCLTLINAYKNMNYTSVFICKSGIWTQIRKAEAIPVKKLDEWLDSDPFTKKIKEFSVVGDGYSTYAPFFDPTVVLKFRRSDQTLDYPEGKTLGKLALELLQAGQTLDWNSIIPLYIRASEAEENKRGLLFAPLK